MFIIILLLLIILFYIEYSRESFDETGTEFVPLGYKRYGLRGEPLTTNPVSDCYYDQYSCYTSTHHPSFTPYDPTVRP